MACHASDRRVFSGLQLKFNCIELHRIYMKRGTVEWKLLQFTCKLLHMSNVTTNSMRNWDPPTGVLPCILNASWYSRVGGASRVNRCCMQDVWVLDYSRSACGCTRAGSIRAPWRERGPRTAHLYQPGTPYWENWTGAPNAQLQAAYILFRGGEQAGLGRLTDTPYRYARILDPDGRLEGLLLAAARVPTSAPAHGFWQAQGLLCRVFESLLAAQPQSAENWRLSEPQQGSTRDSLAARVDAHLREHVGEPLRLESLAQALHVSLSRLCHGYKAERGESPMLAWRRLRIEFAKGLILRGEGLDHVAARTGFVDAFHLSKTFKKLLGCSPRAFLRQGG